jgi:hypothetical protein
VSIRATFVPADIYFGIVNLMGAYSWANDARDYRALGRCFSPDAVLESGFQPNPLPLPARGRDAVVAAIVSGHSLRPATIRRHVITNIDITHLRGDHVGVRSYYAAVQTGDNSGPAVRHTGWYEDIVTRAPGGTWWIAKRIGYRDGNVPTPILVRTTISR